MDARLFIAIYSDEHIAPQLARALRVRGYEAQSSLEVGMANKPDREHFAYAIAREFAVMTNDQGFKELAHDWIAQGQHHYGLIMLPYPMGISELFKRSLVLLNTFTADEAIDQIFYLSNFG